MMTPEEYRKCAADYIMWANEADTDELREGFLKMARQCIERAKQAEYLHTIPADEPRTTRAG
jgi:hypothetical protein